MPTGFSSSHNSPFREKTFWRGAVDALKQGIRFGKTYILEFVLAWVGLSANPSSADTLSVVSWNLGLGATNQQPTPLLERAGEYLRELNADVILLQEVPDWRACNLLAQTLQPLNYSVTICSAFHNASGSGGQVAILSKRKAYFTWAENHESTKEPTENGFVFAAIETEQQRIGLFSGLLFNGKSGDALAKRMLASVSEFKGWETNQLQSLLVAASSETGVPSLSHQMRALSAALEEAGLVDANADTERTAEAGLSGSLFQRSVIQDCLFTGLLAYPSKARVLSVTGFTNHLLGYTIELDPDRATAAFALREDNLRELRAQTITARKQVLSWAAGGLLLAVFIVKLVRARRRKRRTNSIVSSLPVPHRPRPMHQARPIIYVQNPAQSSEPQTGTTIPTPRLKVSPRYAHRLPKLQDAPSEPQESGLEHLSKPMQSSKMSDVPLKAPIGKTDQGVREGVIRELSTWIKAKFVRRLLNDRSQMLQAQELATRMASTLDTRLARIEAQIQHQNLAYNKRIEELNRELTAAREENRELIRERIAQVKAEMEAARAKVPAEAKLSNDSLRL